MMTQTETKNYSKLVVATIALITLASCGNTKSKQDPASSHTFSSTSIKPLASCNKTVTADMSLNSAAVQDQMGTVDYNWLKVKFNFLSSQSTAANNKVKFFKWKVVNGQPYLDQNPLVIHTYDLSTGALSGSASNEIIASTVTPGKGYYVQLNDTQGTFQVLKTVVYSSTGSIVAQSDSLIPQFNAKPSDYQFNADGSPRASALQSLHPLVQTVTSAWSEVEYTNHFQAFCF